MNDKKHIDRLFQEKFKNFEATPDDAVWDNIHNALHKDKRKRRVIPIWWFAGGAAALLVLLLTVGNVFNNGEDLGQPEHNMVGTEHTRDSSESNEKIKVDENDTSSSRNNNDDSNAIANTDSTEDAAVTSKKNTINQIGNDKNKITTKIANEDASERNGNNRSNSESKLNPLEKKKTTIANSKEENVAKNTSNLEQSNSNKEDIDQNNERVKTIFETDKEQSKIAKVTDQNRSKDTEALKEDEDIITLNKDDESIEEAIAKANSTNEEEKEEQPNRWNITPNVAPVYFNSLGKGSTIHSQFVNNSKSGEVNMSYGISGSYAINDKIKIRAGINKVDLGYSTDGVIAFRNVNSFSGNTGNEELRNINFSNQAKADAYLSTSNINSDSAPQFVVANSNGALEQQFGYIEFPLEVEYNIVNNKFGFSVIGGFSTLFLNNNEVYSVLENQRSLLGEANNINSTSYSANFGLGFNYNLSHTLKLNLEPLFKYQLNTFTNTSGDFRPYFIGVYTGFSFKF